MKIIITFLFLLGFVAVKAQTKDEKELTEKTYLLSHTVFGTKDSLTLEKLLAKTVSYGHSHGNLQTREEMIKGVSRNQSNYTDTAVSGIKIFIEDKTAIVRYLFKAKENKKDGTVTDLDFSMMLVWIKEKGKWKLMGRQAVSLK
ncbi:nuclear transport factor 2 family protein [Ferruginibacter sp. SUN106]|uniref:nuclear transport factor 2 family protein n=1 Tax=Ferruginibacter sp. SUN106 TaxID=2978348 RepID=UPI003D36BD4B